MDVPGGMGWMDIEMVVYIECAYSIVCTSIVCTSMCVPVCVYQ